MPTYRYVAIGPEGNEIKDKLEAPFLISYAPKTAAAVTQDALDEAEEIATDRLEDEARRRAVEGVAEPLVSAGKLVRDEALAAEKPASMRCCHAATGRVRSLPRARWSDCGTRARASS